MSMYVVVVVDSLFLSFSLLFHSFVFLYALPPYHFLNTTLESTDVNE